MRAVSPAGVTVLAVVLAGSYAVLSFLAWGMDFTVVDSAIAETALVTRSQVQYAALNAGLNEGDLACLEKQGTCIPSQAEAWAGQALIHPSANTPSLAARTRPERRRWFIPGPPADPGLIAAKRLSPSSVKGFAFLADSSTGRPWWASLSPFKRPPAGFCGDHRGLLCELATAPNPAYKSPVCPTDCRPLSN